MFQSLTIEQLRKTTPSVFTECGSEKTSGKYQHISTARLIDAMSTEGFVVVWATQSNCRLENKINYTKHMLRFRHLSARPTPSGLYPEIVLVNSHDGLSSYRLMAGIFRMVCANGLVAGNFYSETRVRHQGNIIDQVIEGGYAVIDESREMIESAERMAGIALHPVEANQFAEKAHTIRFADTPLVDSIEPKKLLAPRRFADNKNDLFTVFNVVQENIIKGGVRGYTISPNAWPKKITSRAISSIDQNITTNRALWSLAENTMQNKIIH